MAYQPPNQHGYGAPPPQNYYPPQGPPQGHSPQPPYGQQPYGAPPPTQYGQPAPYGQAPPPNQYPPPQPGYGQAPPYGQPPPNQYPPQGHSPQPPYNQAPPPQGYPPQGYPPTQPQYPPAGQPQYAPPAAYPTQQFPPAPPTLGYGPAQHIGWDGSATADAVRKAMKGMGTDEKALIKNLADKDPLQVNVIREAYKQRHNRDLIKDVKSEVSGWFEEGLCAIIRGPLQQDVYLLHDAMAGPGTKEKVLNDILLGRSNTDLRIIKNLYQQTYRTSLEADVKADLSMKTERHFLMVLAANRAEDAAPVIPQAIEQDTMDLYRATEGKTGTDELLVCNLLTSRNDNQIRAIATTYQQKFTRDLETVIKKEFSGHMEDALLHQLRTATDKAMRDALLLEDAMAGAGTKDHLLVNRVVRAHWDRNHLQQVKGAYQHRFHRSLSSRIKGETSGDYERLMVACLGE